MWPSDEDNAEASCTAPMTSKMTGQVFEKEKNSPRIWSSRKSTPTVMTTAGPIKLRMVQRRQLQRTRLLIETYPLPTPILMIAPNDCETSECPQQSGSTARIFLFCKKAISRNC